MKKTIAAALVAALVLAAAAFAASSQINTYKVTAKTSPITAGSTKKPVPVSLTFKYDIGETNNQRPAVVDQYAIKFAGIWVNQKGVKTCSAQQINARQSNVICPKGSLVGTGKISNTVGLTSDPTSKAAECTLSLHIYNSPKNHAALYIGAPDQSEKCAGVPLSQAIDAAYTRSGTSTTLRFAVPSTLNHPGSPTISNAVTSVSSTINRIRVGKVGYYSSVGGCLKKKRNVTVTFHQEDGLSRKAQTFAACK